MTNSINFSQDGTVFTTAWAKDVNTMTYSNVVNVATYGATGNGVTDDTAAIQAAITFAAANGNGEVYFPPVQPTQYYKTTAPLTVTGPVSFRGGGPNDVQIIGTGLSAGQYVLDINCLAANNVEQITIQGLTLRSDNKLPNALHIKNASFTVVKNVRCYNVSNGIVIEGTRCFTQAFEELNNTLITNASVQFISGFSGGGQFTFLGCTFEGNIGVNLPTTAAIDSLNFTGCNFEACVANSMVLAGTCSGLTIVGSRTEACTGIDFVIRPFLSTEYVAGINISGNVFSASGNAGAARIAMGGDSGKIRGFSITGNIVAQGAGTYATNMITLNGDGESGLVSGNYIQGTNGTGAGVISGTRAGVVVFGNENLSGKLTENWGTATWGVAEGTWTPVDGSGAALAITGNGRYTKIGRSVFWQAFISYPINASGVGASIAGLPFTVGGLTGFNEGRSGAHVDVSNVGSAVGILQGLPGATSIAFYNPTANSQILNSTLTNKILYCSGTYTL